jgi:hypothetical protein
MAKQKSKNKSPGSLKRSQFFDSFSRNLNNVKRHPKIRIQPNLDEGYLCPICFKIFDREALSISKEYDDHLTLEDVPSKFLGGKVRALTCKICNNWAGTELESDLGKKLMMDEFLAGVPGVKIKTRFSPASSIDLTAIAQFTPDKILDIRYDSDRSNPNDLERFRELKNPGEISSFTLQFRPYKINRPEIALIRIAYLLAFAHFGYGFLMSYNLMYVRHQIQSSAEKILPDWGILPVDFPDSAVGISVIAEPKELQSFLVVYDLKTKNRSTRHGVILPGPTKPGLDVYKQLADLRTAGEKSVVNLRYRVISKENYLEDPHATFASHYFWENFRES